MSFEPEGRSLLPSLLDRLARAASPTGRAAPARLDDLRDAVLRDLLILLNSRRVQRTLAAPLDDSLLAFGLPDLSTARLDQPAARERLRVAIAEAIRRFEPRLYDIRVAVDPGYPSDLRLRFRIEAMLRVEPQPHLVAAETSLDLPTRAFALQSDAPGF